MDAKTLSGILGHTNASFTLNVYSHITDTMREQAAVKIDRSIGGTDAQIPRTERKSEVAEKPPFEPYKPKIRKTREECEEKLAELIKK